MNVQLRLKGPALYVTLSVIIIALSGCTDLSNRPEPKRDEARAIKIPIQTLFDEAKDSDSYFGNRYGDQTLEVSGGSVIQLHSIIGDSIQVIVDDGRINWCLCEMPMNPENLKAAQSLKLNGRATVVGVFVWNDYKYGMISLEDCAVKPEIETPLS